ncbi:cohesin domain-containing protein [Patescibacteria group bacterium]|nr:cohesin domain-containing protein [Patescibacteria group bacterium]
MKIFNLRYYIFIACAAIVSLAFLPSSALAAELNVQTQNSFLSSGDQFRADITINAQNQDINAISGNLVYDASQLEVKQILDGQSIISFWVDSPKQTTDGEIKFSGIVPGGYDQDGGLLFSVIFQATGAAGSAGNISLVQGMALLNDGHGTSAQVTEHNFEYQILKNAGTAPAVSQPADKTPPESFTPLLGRDPNIFNDKWFLAFSTTDKGSGIDHYEIKENWWQPYIVAQSPYLIKNQKLNSPIYVKAVDKSGNIRIERVAAKNPLPWYENIALYVIIAVIVLLIISYVYRNKK